MRVTGRDFAFACNATASNITGWELIGGMPLSPSVLASSGLRAFVQSYANFKVNKIVFHYITSSPTSQAGDIAFYYERDRSAPAPDTSNANFLPFVLSDPHTVLGPQWTNHSAVVTPAADWKSTCYGVNPDLSEEGSGNILFYSKTNTSNSPGYVIMDYDITFKELSVNPRAGVLPIARGLYNATTIQFATVGNTALSGTIAGQDISGLTAVAPSGLTLGDIYKFVFSVSASTVRNTWTTATLSTAVRYEGINFTLDDGFTCYMYWDGSAWTAYPTLADAMTNTKGYRGQQTATIYFSGFMSLVTVTGPTVNQFAY